MNPYLNEGMITNAEKFFGREEEVKRIYLNLKTTITLEDIKRGIPQGSAIFGPNKIGKSSLLYYVYQEKEKQLENPEKYIFIFLNLKRESIKSPSEFFTLTLRELSKEGGDKIIIDPNLDNYENFKNIVSELYRRDYKLVLFLDDFDVIINNNNFKEGFYSNLRALAPYNVAYVIATIKELTPKEHGKIVSSPFFNIFSSIRLNLFKSEDAIKLIEMPSKRERVLLKDDSDFILDIAGLHPFLIQIACSILFEYKSVRRKLGKSDYEKIKEEFLNESKAYFEYIWGDLNDKEKEVLLKLAKSKPVDIKDMYIFENLERKGYVIKKEEGTLFKKTVKYDLFSSVFKKFILEKG